jgi:hypothetical protein
MWATCKEKGKKGLELSNEDDLHKRERKDLKFSNEGKRKGDKGFGIEWQR